MRNFFGISFLVVGFLTIILGGLSVFIYYLHDLIVNAGTMSSGEILLAIIMMVFRDIIPIVMGLIFLGIGYAIKKD
jgi:hypothetical protein|tara:strand:- start:1598 stop:1825 length:228 start_codon:yes stop_codon:yes gene_type:complete